ncbi:hypothetical protein A3A39_01040 [Candidatus Kaiserbacteria bacterium RIFCSPLOWO2_01_FULL_54_13]|uniref:Transmembrane protein n=1 Tax=Candidatus Kaiserbacteria bacterium RIFCSPLOWO2_01_FULL_54_13 TaxID=1798512 RepID=A0A1F6F271_9BACT|nr:MAG: hypothetical protein A3A39_01040 [Candidatus Kaiserbacteria bacterium RIFCSPLOWO2_01_FULL_54_13]
MKFWVTSVLTIGVVAVGVFGFVGMSHDMSHGSGCIASVVNKNAVCPEDALSSALYHITAYKTFSEFTIASTFFALITLLLLLLAAVLATKEKLRPIPLRRQRVRWQDDFHTSHREKFLRWLSLFENSPSRICGA